MQYKLVSAYDNYYIEDAMKKLEKKVNMLTKEGWRPQGGVAIGTHSYNQYNLLQAMIKP